MIHVAHRVLAPAAFIASVAAAMSFVPQQNASQPLASAASSSDRMMIGAMAMGPACIAEIPGVPMSLCFIPGTPAEEVATVTKRLQEMWAADLAARDSGAGGDGGTAYQLGNRWSINGSSLNGSPVTLRWSMPADGLSVPDGLSGGAASPNNLLATFATKFGSADAGKNLVRLCFAAWSNLSGITYTEVTDDNAAWGSAGGTTRGDIRIVGRTFGATGVLAYTYYPNNGDMVFVTSNSNYWSAANNNRYFRNVFMHEHGHGMGIAHTCPVSQTQLMEPYASTAFDGPQTDDVRAAQRFYGDRYELVNDLATTAPAPFNATGTTAVTNVSIDDNLDVDWFKFDATIGSTVSITVSPTGPTSYLSGPQNADGSCSAGSAVAPRTIHNLGVAIYRGANGGTLLTSSDSAAAGSSEVIQNFVIPATDTFAIKVFPSTTTDDIQVYSIAFTINPAPALPGDFDGDGHVGGNDLGILLASWGPVTCGNQYDLNNDCVVNGGDMGILLANWG
jgi:hypothetical protein